MTQHLDPARSVVESLGGVRPLARTLGVSPSTVSRWMMPKASAGTGGFIPQRHWPALMQEAGRQRKRLTLKKLSGM